MNYFTELGDKIREKSSVVTVVGLGYVVLPLSLNIVKKGFRVVGYDVDRSKIDSLERGEPYISNINLS